MRNTVEGNLMGELVDSQRLAIEELSSLIVELVHCGCAGTRCRLIGRDNNTLDGRKIMEWLKRHYHLDSRTIGIGDYT